MSERVFRRARSFFRPLGRNRVFGKKGDWVDDNDIPHQWRFTKYSIRGAQVGKVLEANKKLEGKVTIEHPTRMYVYGPRPLPSRQLIATCAATSSLTVPFSKVSGRRVNSVNSISARLFLSTTSSRSVKTWSICF